MAVPGQCPLDELRPIVKHLAEHWQQHIPPSLRRAFISWLNRVVASDKGVTLTSSDVEDFAEVQVSLSTRIKQWEQEIRKQEFEKGVEQGIKRGIEQGIEKGIEQGILTGEAHMLQRLLRLRFGSLPVWVDDKLARANRPELEHWGAKVLDAKSLDDVFE